MRPTSLDFLASAANARILGNASRNVFDVKIDSREATIISTAPTTTAAASS